MIDRPPSPLHQVTRPLKSSVTPAPANNARSSTGSLTRVIPWVIELRVVGTTNTLQVKVGSAMVIGRGDASQGVSPEIDLTNHGAFQGGVSRQHAVFVVRPEGLFIRDLNSTNGTLVNGSACTPGVEYRIRHGDDLTLGKLRMQVLFAVAPETETAPEFKPIPTPASGKGQHILVIEDDKEVGNVFKLALEQAGFSVTVTTDVARALGVCYYRMPDAVVLDLMLPDTNGMDLIRYMRKQYPNAHIPMLVCSSATAGFQMQQAISAGADVFLGKPIAIEKLVEAVTTAVKPKK